MNKLHKIFELRSVKPIDFNLEKSLYFVKL